MAERIIRGDEALNCKLPLGFKFDERVFIRSLSQMDDLLREAGFPESALGNKSISSKVKKKGDNKGFTCLKSSLGNGLSDVDGGLWVSPQGKFYDVKGYHTEFILENPALFGLSEEEESYAINVVQNASDISFGLSDQEDFLLSIVLPKGWVRVRFNKGLIFVSVVRSGGVHRLLRKTATALIDYGFSFDSVLQVEILEDEGVVSCSKESLSSLIVSRVSAGLWGIQVKWVQGFLTKEQAIDKIVNLTGKPRNIAERILDSWGSRFSSYTPLHSGDKSAIFSMAASILAKLQPVVNTFFVGLSKQVLKRFPGGTFNYVSEEFSWKVYDKEKNLLMCLGVRDSDGAFMYWYKDKVGQAHSGYTVKLSTLKEIVAKVGV